MLLKFSAVHLKFGRCAQKFTSSSTSAAKLDFKLEALLRNPESQEILLMESGILSFGIRNTDQGIWNPNNDRNPEFYCFTEKYWNPKPGIRNPQRGIQNPRLCWIIPLHGVKDEYL